MILLFQFHFLIAIFLWCMYTYINCITISQSSEIENPVQNRAAIHENSIDQDNSSVYFIEELFTI